MKKTSVTRIQDSGDGARLFRKRLQLDVLEGPDRGRSITSARERVTVGSAEQNDLVLTDSAVSRHHLRIEPTPDGFVISDLGSTNGTSLGTMRVREIVIQDRTVLSLGDTVLRIEPLDEEEEVELAGDHFGSVLGQSPSMRELFHRLEAISPLDVTVLLTGETGTGKELIAREIHEHSKRKDRPFLVLDCGAIPPTLIESELFGHERGAFTHAESSRPGVFEEAEGGTVFLDEIGELDLPMQPRLLRVLERGEVKRLGSAHHKKLDIRLIAATNKDLERSVNAGTFRADLFYRLAVVHLSVPPLRDRPEDVEMLVETMLPEIAARLGVEPAPVLALTTVQQLIDHPWPGNVRELRNFLERLVALSGNAVPDLPSKELSLPAPPPLEDLDHLPFREAKARWVEHFDLMYLTRLLERHRFNVAEAARESGIDRVHLFRLIKKYRLKDR